MKHTPFHIILGSCLLVVGTGFAGDTYTFPDNEDADTLTLMIHAEWADDTDGEESKKAYVWQGGSSPSEVILRKDTTHKMKVHFNCSSATVCLKINGLEVAEGTGELTYNYSSSTTQDNLPIYAEVKSGGGDSPPGPLGTSSADLQHIDLVGYQATTLGAGSPTPVAETDEDSPGNLKAFVNVDDDDEDGAADNGDDVVDGEDDDIVKLRIKAPGGNVGTVKISADSISSFTEWKGSDVWFDISSENVDTKMDLEFPAGLMSGLQNGSDIDFWIEGDAVDDDVTFKYVLENENSNEVASDEVHVEITDDLQVAEPSDYIVPKSGNNVVRYKWYNTTSPDSVDMEVINKNDNTIRTITSLPTSFVQGQQYAEHKWDGLDNSSNPLTQSDSPYKIKIKAKWGTDELSDTLGDRKVKEWYLTLQMKDEEAYAGATVSKIDKDSVTKTGDKLTVTRAFDGESGSSDPVPYYSTAEDGDHVNVVLKKGTGATDYYIFYTTPTSPSDVSIKYKVSMKVTDVGCVDKAGNQWDMKDSTAATWENKAEWTFEIDASGNMTGLVEQFTEE